MELLARETQLEEQIKPLKEQSRDVRVMLVASASGTCAPIPPEPSAVSTVPAVPPVRDAAGRDGVHANDHER